MTKSNTRRSSSPKDYDPTMNRLQNKSLPRKVPTNRNTSPAKERRKVLTLNRDKRTHLLALLRSLPVLSVEESRKLENFMRSNESKSPLRVVLSRGTPR